MTERSIFSEAYRYLSGVVDVEELPVDLPGVESVSIMSGTAPNKSPFKDVLLQYRRLDNRDDLFER